MVLWVLYTQWNAEQRNALRECCCMEAFLPPERKARLHTTDPERLFQAAAAYALLRFGVKHLLGIPELPALTYGTWGKPAFQEVPALQFSLSHTEGLALCALSDASVGVDGEQLRPVSAERARRLVLSREPADFFAGWVERESRVKCRGVSAIACRKPVEARAGERYYALPVGEDYAAGLCTLSPEKVHMRKILPALLLDGKNRS